MVVFLDLTSGWRREFYLLLLLKMKGRYKLQILYSYMSFYSYTLYVNLYLLEYLLLYIMYDVPLEQDSRNTYNWPN